MKRGGILHIPTTDRGRASLGRIIDAACELFYRRGVAATGLDDIARASGTGKGQLYHYFDDKPDLILAAISAQIAALLSVLGPQLAAVRTADDLGEWVQQIVALHSHGGPVRCPLGALVVELADNHPDLRRALDEGFSRWRDDIAGAIAGLQASGAVDAHRDPGQLAELFLCAYEGGIVMAEVRGSTTPLELALDAVVEVILCPGHPLSRSSTGSA